MTQPQELQSPPDYCEYAAGACDQDFEGTEFAVGTFLYPALPKQIAGTIEATIDALRRRAPGRVWRSWKEFGTPGQIIFCGICKSLRFSNRIVADVTTLNFNLLFEIGFALGLELPVIPIRDTTIITNQDDFRDLGLIDTLGYLDFQNSDELADGLLRRDAVKGIPAPKTELNRESPLYVVKAPIATEGDVRLMATLRKSAVNFRTYDTIETPRLSLHEARRQIGSSLAIVTHLLSPSRKGATVHNARCALLAGVAMALQKAVLLIQEDVVQQPIDYRDVVCNYTSPDQVPRLVEPFLRDVITLLQDSTVRTSSVRKGLLEQIDLGDIAAENESQLLRYYFVRTAQFNEARRGSARLVVGRKGAGKTALFYGVRDAIPKGHSHLIVDLKPEGYQFTKLREVILSKLSLGLQEHTLTAFWNYILLCEIAEQIRDNDYGWAQRDPGRWKRFQTVMNAYGRQAPAEVGDFSERLLRQIDKMVRRFEGAGRELRTGGELTQALFEGEIRVLDDALSPYLEEKDDVWVLVDNLDKGWPTRGTRSSDILILRTLLEATRKLQRQFAQPEVGFHCLVFLRNDIYEHLLLETPDRGKDTVVALEWDDREVFKELVRRRILSSASVEGEFDDLWARIATSYIGTRDSFGYIVERTLMRPRDLLSFLHRAIGVAINRGHDRVQEQDILKAEESYSEDMLYNTAFELRDVHPEMMNVLYMFNRSPIRIAKEKALALVSEGVPGHAIAEELLDLLMWFGFLGIHEFGQDEAVYAYEVRHNVDKLRTLLDRGLADLAIHPAFHRALSCTA